MGCMSKQQLKSQSVNGSKGARECSWKFEVKCNGEKIYVCKNFFLYVHQIKCKRLRVIQEKMKKDIVDMVDRRGKHKNKPNKISHDIYEYALKHLYILPNKKSHYTNSTLCYFENCDLTIKKICELFKKYYFDETGVELKMAYNTYRQWFSINSPIRIKEPRTDTCDFCKECESKLNFDQTDACSVKYTEHCESIAAYHKLKNEKLKDCKDVN